jgi:phosphoglycerate dehydrogenase-like enzyme
MNIAIWITQTDIPEWEFSQQQAAQLQTAIPGASIKLCQSAAEFRENLKDATIALTWRCDQEWIEGTTKLRLLSTPSAGHDLMDFDPPDGITMHYGKYHGAIMGETAMAMMLGCARRLLTNAPDMKSPINAPWPREAYSGRVRCLKGAHLVIVGFGEIGSHVARLAKPFGMRITGLRRNPPAQPPACFDQDDRILAIDQLDQVLPTADHLLLILPNTPETNGMFDARRLALLPPHAYLYNLGRGNSVDEDALIDALAMQRLAGAALDVFQTEPLPLDSPLRRAPNCFIYPHIAALAPEYLDLYLREVVGECKNLNLAP